GQRPAGAELVVGEHRGDDGDVLVGHGVVVGRPEGGKRWGGRRADRHRRRGDGWCLGGRRRRGCGWRLGGGRDGGRGARVGPCRGRLRPCRRRRRRSGWGRGRIRWRGRSRGPRGRGRRGRRRRGRGVRPRGGRGRVVRVLLGGVV